MIKISLDLDSIEQVLLVPGVQCVGLAYKQPHSQKFALGAF